MTSEKIKEITLGFLVAVWATLTPIHTILYAVFGLVFADLVAGVLKSLLVKGEKFSSNRLRDTSVKLVPYLLIVLAGFGLDKILGDTGLLFSRAFAVLIGGTEVTSLGENLKEITGLDLGAVIRAKLKPPTPPPPPAPPAP